MEDHLSESRTALLIVDVQVGLVALMPAGVRDSVLPKIKTLLAKARASGVPVIYIQHDGTGASAGDPYGGLGDLSFA
jgi:nicotinamidase-related amidase